MYFLTYINYIFNMYKLYIMFLHFYSSRIRFFCVTTLWTSLIPCGFHLLIILSWDDILSMVSFLSLETSLRKLRITSKQTYHEECAHEKDRKRARSIIPFPPKTSVLRNHFLNELLIRFITGH